jgi:hypothetical protein
MKNSTAIIVDFGCKRRSRFFVNSRTPPPLIHHRRFRKSNGDREVDLWRQGSAMGRALVKPPEGNRRPGEGLLGWMNLDGENIG